MPTGSGATQPEGGLTPRHLAAEYATARVLAESARLVEAMPQILEAICRTLGWDYGALWRVDPHDNVLRLIAAWHMPGTGFAEFETLSRETSFASGVGLPGRVWAAARPAFIPDVLKDENFPRAPAAAREHLHAAFGFPVVLEHEVLGVMEFFSRDIREPDEELLTMLDTIGRQIGQFIERRRAEEDLNRFFALSVDMLCIAGFDGYFRRINPAWQRTLGFTDAELYAQPYLVGWPWVSRPRFCERCTTSGRSSACCWTTPRWPCSRPISRSPPCTATWSPTASWRSASSVRSGRNSSAPTKPSCPWQGTPGCWIRTRSSSARSSCAILMSTR